jgi:2-C-methyl-D-erythritol 4-phosphate cytidylyltransferase
MEHQAICDSVNTNYLGMINIALASLDYLKKSKGNLLFLRLVLTQGPCFFFSIYSSAKAATVNFVQAISQEWEPFDVK